MKRSLGAAAVSLTLLGGSLAAAAPAHAADPICTGYGANHRLDWGHIKSLSTKHSLGFVELCQRKVNGSFIRWTNVQLTYTMNSTDRAGGRIMYRRVGTTDENAASTCAKRPAGQNGGTGVIYAPDRTCATGRTVFISGYEDRADAYIYNVNNKIIGVGTTDWIPWS